MQTHRHANDPLTRQDISEYALGETRYVQYVRLVEVLENTIKFGLLGGRITLEALMDQVNPVKIEVHMIPDLIDENGLLDMISSVLYFRLQDSGLCIVGDYRTTDGVMLLVSRP